jgi:hypothetical protein
MQRLGDDENNNAAPKRPTMMQTGRKGSVRVIDGRGMNRAVGVGCGMAECACQEVEEGITDDEDEMWSGDCEVIGRTERASEGRPRLAI